MAALQDLAGHAGDLETEAYAAWAAGKAALQLEGRMEAALLALDRAAARFAALGDAYRGAEVQLNRMHALAMLGRYDEAVAGGLAARDTFVDHGDELAAGRVEQNLGNIYRRRDRYGDAEQFYRQAHERFRAAGDRQELARVYNNLADVLAWRHQFRAAEGYYQLALSGARAANLEALQALVEGNLGLLALFQGRYDAALTYLEQSRRRYSALAMPHEVALADQMLADAYLELNLAPEARGLYARVIPSFAELGMRFEQAWSLARHGRACLQLGLAQEGARSLAEARALFALEESRVGEALVALAEAQLQLAGGDVGAAASTATAAEGPLAEAGLWGWALHARWARAEALRRGGDVAAAQATLAATLRESETYALPHIAQLCHTSAGQLAAAAGDRAGATAAFERAVGLIEALRAPLPAEEFRAAFFADKLTPYVELARLSLEAAPPRAEAALGYVERARSRALLDALATGPSQPPASPGAALLTGRLQELREELSWLYSQLYRPVDGELGRGAEAAAELQAAIGQREALVLETTRQLEQAGGRQSVAHGELDVAALREKLGPDTALVEYFNLGDELLAFVVTAERVVAVRAMASLEALEGLVGQLRFQTDALRRGVGRSGAHHDQLRLRAERHLGRLYDLLIRPLAGLIEDRRLVVVPHRALHYVPFHALLDGASPLLDRCEVIQAPSAAVLQRCLAQPRRPPRRGLLLGVPDERAPKVRDEVLALAPLLDEATALVGEEASLGALRAGAADADVLHLACHGQFRHDNPLFSALRLGDGWLTVRDAYGLRLGGAMVVLSACETGVSAIAPGDELIGLARGFFAAGAPTILVSLWTVDDSSTAELMLAFYRRLLGGDRPAAALRAAQRAQRERTPHPFYWAPFVLLGCW